MTLPQPGRDHFWREIEALKIPRPVLREISRRKASFVRPEMKVRVRHLRDDEMLRHAAPGDRVILRPKPLLAARSFKFRAAAGHRDRPAAPRCAPAPSRAASLAGGVEQRRRLAAGGCRSLAEKAQGATRRHRCSPSPAPREA